MSCANTEAANVAVTMTKRVVGGHAALRGAICTQKPSTLCSKA